MSSTTALPCWSSAELRCLQGTRLKTAAGVREEVFAVESTNNSAVLRVSSWARVPFKVPVWIWRMQGVGSQGSRGFCCSEHLWSRELEPYRVISAEEGVVKVSSARCAWR